MHKLTVFLYLFISISIHESLSAQLRVGDAGILFDATKFDDTQFPQMRKWVTAGVTDGIPLQHRTPIKKTIDATNSAGLNAAILEVVSLGGGGLRLKNGTYTIDNKVNMKSNVRLMGETQEGVVLNITMMVVPPNSADAIEFSTIDKAGIENVTIQGGYGEPNDFTMADTKPEFLVNSVNMYYATNCWLSDVTILNSGNHAITIWRGAHNTIRDCYIERSWNKGAGGHGYVQIQTPYCLMYNTTVKKMRHIAIQSVHSEYNVFFKNTVEQDFNFHNADNGNNLVEQNTVVLPEGLENIWNAVMGPWSVQHTISVRDNFVYRNTCTENNNGGVATFSDTTVVYLGSRARQQQGGVFVTSTATPTGGTFYPVKMGANNAGFVDLDVKINAVSTVLRRYVPVALTVSLSNRGNQKATNIKVDVPYPMGMVQSGKFKTSLGVYTGFWANCTKCGLWTIPELAAGQTATLEFALFPNDVSSSKTVIAKILNVDQPDTVTENDIASVTFSPNTPSLTHTTSDMSIRVYPNPFIDNVVLEIISVENNEANLLIYNSLGSLIKSEKKLITKGLNTLKLDCADFKDGIYFAVLKMPYMQDTPIHLLKIRQ
jgi:hypothetical protein